MRRERDYLPKDFFVDRFITGLEEGIRHTVQCQKPQTLLSAYWYARQYEKAYLSIAKRPTPPAPAIRPVAPPQLRPIQARDPRPRAPADRVREPKKCWYCPENWTLGHRCHPMQRALNTITMQGHSDDELPEEEVHPLQGMAEEEQQLPQADAIPPHLPPDDREQVMNISASAYRGCPTESTLSLLLNFPQAQTVALADTGSTNTFMDRQFAIRHNIPIVSTQRRAVTVAGGGTLSSTEIARACSFSIQGYKFNTDFRILHLQGSDVILGVNWFKLHNPVTFDFLKRTISMQINQKMHTFHDHLIPKDKFLISSDACSKIIAQGALGYYLMPTTKTLDKPTDTDQPQLRD